MIPKDTIDKILDNARVEEVIGDFISLKKRGANFLGLCPFHQEKTPSFTVSAAKGIYKCFGCGKAGNSVNFIMEHESLSYPEALKYLAKKYNIVVEEKELSVEEKAALTEKESLLIVSSFAQKWFSEQLLNTDMGKSIGYGYFTQRGFTDETIHKFQLGYSPEEKHAFSEAAIQSGYKAQYLINTGLSILPDRFSNETEIKAEHLFDRYAGRVIFPIHNLTGRVIGFGGRILGNDKKIAKYVNSPQSDIYDKSKVLYGLYFAKKSIIQEDNCYLVEGYTDVISMHQAGIENVVSSSGTSLTVDQIRLIHRFTSNITILYDGDSAGIKASFRGIDLILEQGLNVKVLLFPDGDDPDSFSKKTGREEFQLFIKNNAVDFLTFKIDLLLKDAENNPIQRAQFVKDIIDSLALIPDTINRAIYIQELSRQLDLSEQTIITEVNKRIRQRISKKIKDNEQTPSKENVTEENLLQYNDVDELLTQITESPAAHSPYYYCEENMVLYLIHFGNRVIEMSQKVNDEMQVFYTSVAEYIFRLLKHDEIAFLEPTFIKFATLYYEHLQNDSFPGSKAFINHEDKELSQLYINLSHSKNILSDGWKTKYNIHTENMQDDIFKNLKRDITNFRAKIIEKLILDEKQRLLPYTNKSNQEEEDNDGVEDVLIRIMRLEKIKIYLNAELGRVITN
jgi:DNA primase